MEEELTAEQITDRAIEFARTDSSDLSEDEIFHLRLSCILEDEENSDKSSDVSRLPSFRLDNIQNIQTLNNLLENELDSQINNRNVLVRNFSSQISDDSSVSTSETSDNSSVPVTGFGYEIKKLKSGENIERLLKRPIVERRRELSSDSSLDISNEQEDVEICEMEANEGKEVQNVVDNMIVQDISTDDSIQHENEKTTKENVDDDITKTENAGTRKDDVTEDDVTLKIIAKEQEQISEPAKEQEVEHISEPAKKQEVEHTSEPVKEQEVEHISEQAKEQEVEHISEPVKEQEVEHISEPAKEQEVEHISEPPKEQEVEHISEPAKEVLKRCLENMKRSLDEASEDSIGASGETKETMMEEYRDFQESVMNLPTSSFSSGKQRPPIPPETYLWEEIKRLRAKGGYPWTYLDKPEFDEFLWKTLKDHEYEPVNPPRSTKEQSPEIELKKSNSASSIPEHERRLLRMQLDAEHVSGDEEEEELEDVAVAEDETERKALDVEQHEDNRYLSATPTTTETQSRTECDVNTSMLDSSGLEDLPLKRGSRARKILNSKSRTEQMRAHAQGIQSRIKSQAGKLRSKLKNIPRPSFNMKDRPKINFPDRPKFNMPERPKFKLPERPKFNLPERPKFNLPERPKFNFPNRPKLSLPSFGKSKQEREAQGAGNVGPRKNIFDIDFRTYPKIFNRKLKKRGEYATSSPKQTRGRTPPPRMLGVQEPTVPGRKTGPVGQRWVNRFDDIKFADENGSEYKDGDSRKSNRSESISDFREKECGYAEDIDEIRLPPGRRTVSTKSSMSHLSDREIQSSGSSEDRLRKGVLEEIDSDEFFLRQKGISQDDVNMEKYLTQEIREAFQGPVVNALAQMDYDYDLDEKEVVPEEPLKPSRTRSLRKQAKSLDETDRFRTYPPNRPLRKSTSRSKTKMNGYEEARYENVDVDEEYYKSPRGTRYQAQSSYSLEDDEEPTPFKRKRSAKEKEEQKWVEIEIETSVEELEDTNSPKPTKRRKSRKDSTDRQNIVEEPGLEEQVETVVNLSQEPESIVSRTQEQIESPPVAPKRTRSRSRSRAGSRSQHSLIFEETKVEDVSPVVQEVHVEVHRSEDTFSANEYETAGDDGSSVGYATVGKPIEQKPIQPRRQKPPRPPPPRKKRGTKAYNTLPARFTKSPLRPARYSTLGPSRPPRHRIPPTTTSAEHIYIDDVQSQGYVQVLDTLRPLERDDLHGSNKDLQTEEVIEKMKVRPLPAPPRPPRHRSKTDEEDVSELGLTEEAQISLALLRGQESPNFISGNEVVEEVSIAIQTDPIPDEYDEYDVEEHEQEEKIKRESSNGQISKKDTPEVEAEIQKQSQEIVKKSSNMPDGASEDKVEEDKRWEEENKLVEEKKLQLQRIEENIIEQRKQEETATLIQLENESRLEEIKRQEVQKILEEARIKEEQRKLEEARIKEEQRKLEEARIKEEQRKLEEARIKEEQRKLEEQRRMEEVRVQKEREKMEAIKKQEQIRSERLRAEDERLRRLGSEQMQSNSAQSVGKNQSELGDVDMGYASLDRRHKKSEDEEEPQTASPKMAVVKPDPGSTVQVLRTDRLQVDQLEVNKLRVDQLEANSIQVNDLRGNTLNIGEVNSQTGNLMLRNIELPPDFIEQILARIPWEELRSQHNTTIPQGTEIGPTEFSVTRQQRRRFDSEEELGTQSRRHRRHQRPTRYSTDEEEDGGHVIPIHRRPLTRLSDQSVTEIGRHLVRACTASGLRTMRQFSNYVTLQGIQCEDDKRKKMQTFMCVILLIIAGFILIGLSNKEDIHHHHWDFQFPPQPPPQG